MEGTFYPKNDYRDYLAHFGVKGMKWGVRKDRARSGKNRNRPGILGRYVQHRAKKLYARYRKAGDEAAAKAKRWADEEQKLATKYKGKNGADRWLKAQRAYFDDNGLGWNHYMHEIHEIGDERAYARRAIANDISNAKRFRAQYEAESKRWYRQADLMKNYAGDRREARRSEAAEGTQSWDKYVRKTMKKYPQLKDDFGSPDMIDDPEYFELVAMEYADDARRRKT